MVRARIGTIKFRIKKPPKRSPACGGSLKSEITCPVISVISMIPTLDHNLQPTPALQPNGVENGLSGSTEPTTRVYAGLIDCGHAAVRSWFHLRALDTVGQGWVDIDLKEFCKEQGSSSATVYRHLGNKTFFPQVIRAKGGKIRVYMRSLAKACLDVGIDSGERLGACAEFLMKWLGDRHLCAIYATELTLQNGQRQAYHAATRAKKETDKSQIIDPSIAVIQLSKAEERLRIQEQRAARAAGRSVNFTGFKSRRFRFYRISPDQIVPGVTQKQVAKHLGRDERTIRRRSSNRQRARYGIAPLNRRRVLKELPPDVEKRFTEYLSQTNVNFAAVAYGDSIIQIGRIKIGNEPFRTYRLLTNIYEFDFQLIRARRVRAKLNAFSLNYKEQCLTA